MDIPPANEFGGIGRFLLQRLLGQGATGVVYHAYDPKRHMHVAIKVLKPLPESRANALYRFKNEFRKLAELDHPNLVSMYELFAEGERWFYSMEFIDGKDFLSTVRIPLGDTVTRDTVDSNATKVDSSGHDVHLTTSREWMIDVEALKSLLRQLTEALCYIHHQGILHRDVKPSNAMVRKDGHLVLLDFGLFAQFSSAVRNDESYRTTGFNVVGTIPYMSPEQISKQSLTPATDWYSVGVMLYEVLAGRRPFRGNVSQLLIAKLNHDPHPPSSFVRGIPKDLEQLCLALLHRDPRKRPSGEEILAQLGGPILRPSLAGEPAPLARSAPFLGRERHLAELDKALEAVTVRNTVVTVFVHGQSGAGKTTLLQHFLDQFAGSGEVVVLEGRCYEQEAVPYKAVDSLVDALSGYLLRLPRAEADALMPRDVAALARAFPVLRRVDSVAEAPQRSGQIPDQQELRRRAFGALRELLSRLGDRKRLILMIDDLQWGDVDSATLLTELFRPPDPPVMMLLFGYRADDADTSPCIDELLESSRKIYSAQDRFELEVGPLTEDQSQQLALDLLADSDSSIREWAAFIARESQGNPFFIHEFTRYIRETPCSPDSTPSTALDALIWSRLNRLPLEAQRLVLTLAVAGRPMAYHDALRAADLDSAAAPAVIGALRSAHLVRSRGSGGDDQLETLHDRIRETVVQRLSPSQTKSQFSRLAHVLSESPDADHETLAAYFEGAEHFSEAGIHYAEAANLAAEALAFDRAARLYRRALELSKMPPDDRVRMQVRLGDALANAGRGAEAARIYLSASHGAPDTERLRLQGYAAVQSLYSGHFDEGLRVLRTVLKSVGLGLPKTNRGTLLALLVRRMQLRVRGYRFRRRSISQISTRETNRLDLCWSAAVGLAAVDPILGAYYQKLNILMALKSGEPFQVARALAMDVYHECAFRKRRNPHAMLQLDVACELANELDDRYLHGITSFAAGIGAYTRGQWRTALKQCDTAAEILNNHGTGVFWELTNSQVFAMYSLLQLGDINQLNQRLPELLEQSQDRDNLYAVTLLRTGVIPEVLLLSGQPMKAITESHGALQYWSREGIHLPHLFSCIAIANTCLYQGEGCKAWEYVNVEWTQIARSAILRHRSARTFAFDLQARCAIAAARHAANPTAYLVLAAKRARQIDSERERWAESLAQLLFAGVAQIKGDTDRARELLYAAAAGFDLAEMSRHAAAVRWRLGQLLGGSQGQQLIAEADEWMQKNRIVNPEATAFVLLPWTVSEPHVHA